MTSNTFPVALDVGQVDEPFEQRHARAEPIGEGEKLRRWAVAHQRANPPSVVILCSDDDIEKLVFEGWFLGHGVEGRGFDDGCHEWRRREAMIYLTADGRVLCLRLWVSPGKGVEFRQIREYGSDLALLQPLGVAGRDDADKCVQIAAREAARTCPLFGVFGVAWQTVVAPVAEGVRDASACEQ